MMYRWCNPKNNTGRIGLLLRWIVSRIHQDFPGIRWILRDDQTIMVRWHSTEGATTTAVSAGISRKSLDPLEIQVQRLSPFAHRNATRETSLGTWSSSTRNPQRTSRWDKPMSNNPAGSYKMLQFHTISVWPCNCICIYMNINPGTLRFTPYVAGMIFIPKIQITIVRHPRKLLQYLHVCWLESPILLIHIPWNPKLDWPPYMAYGCLKNRYVYISPKQLRWWGKWWLTTGFRGKSLTKPYMPW